MQPEIVPPRKWHRFCSSLTKHTHSCTSADQDDEGADTDGKEGGEAKPTRHNHEMRQENVTTPAHRNSATGGDEREMGMTIDSAPAVAVLLHDFLSQLGAFVVVTATATATATAAVTAAAATAAATAAVNAFKEYNTPHAITASASASTAPSSTASEPVSPAPVLMSAQAFIHVSARLKVGVSTV